MLQLGIRGLGIARFKFNPISWFLKGEQGAWYDPSDLTTLFQDSAGTIPVTAVEQPVGLMLDKSRGLALGAELVTNGGFATDTGWTKGTGWTITGGQGVLTAGAGILQQTMGTVVVGTSYTVSINTNLAIQLRVGSANIGYFSPVNNTILCFITAIAGALIEIIPNGTQTGYVDNISVKKIAGNHAFQATAGNRPVLSARVNLLTYSQDFSNGTIWSQGTAPATNNATTAPDGTVTAASVIPTTTFNYHFIGNTLTSSGGTSTHSCYVKANGYTKVALRESAASGYYAAFNLTAATVLDQTATYVTNPSITLIGNGWYRISATILSSVSQGFSIVCVPNTYTTGNPVTAWTPDGVSGIYIWGADLRPTNSGALLPPYQRVNTASDYDTVGFPLYLKANGTSSAMSTNSIDFTATDKMTVVTGVRKLSDSLDANVVSLGLAPQNGVGTFEVSAPNTYGAVSNNNFSWLLAQSQTTITRANLYATPFVAPIASVLSCNFNFGGATLADQILPRVNRVIPTLTASALGTYAGAGNFGNHSLYLFTRGSTSLFFNGQFYGAIIRGAQSDTASVTQTENYMAQKTGIKF